MKAYLKDMEANPDYTSKLIHDKVEEKRKQMEEEQKIERLSTEEFKKNDTDKREAVEGEHYLWYEAKSDEGYTYYWNYSTGGILC